MGEPSWKTKQYEILCRIDDVCRQNNIRMMLAEDTALLADREGSLSDNVSVAIDARDVRTFISAMEKDPQLKIRGIFNYYRYSQFNIRVYDPETIDLNLHNYGKLGYCGLSVTVHPLQHIPDDIQKKKAVAKTKKAYKDYIKEKYDGVERTQSNRLRAMKAAAAVMPWRHFNKAIFNILLNKYSEPSTVIAIGKRRYPAELFDNFDMVRIGQREFNIPANKEEFFTIRYGYDWRNAQPHIFKETNYHFRDGNYSWDDFRERIGYLDIDEYSANYDLINLATGEIQKEQEYISYSVNLFRRTHYRFVLWGKYFPMKDKLKKLHNKGDYETLSGILEPYLRCLSFMKTKDMTVCFDKEIFEIAVDTIRSSGNEKFADEIMNLVPAEHIKPIRIVNHKGEYIS